MSTTHPVDADPVLAARPCGPVVTATVGDWGRATATFSADLRHRFRLSRVWDPAGPRVTFLMLNPSTADAFQVDPTIRRCLGFARAWSAGSVEVANAFAFRSTDPAGLRRVDDPVGDGNDQAIEAAARAADVVVAAWGVHAIHLGRGTAVRNLLHDLGVPLHHLKLTKSGHPCHPLYLPRDLTPQPW